MTHARDLTCVAAGAIAAVVMIWASNRLLAAFGKSLAALLGG